MKPARLLAVIAFLGSIHRPATPRDGARAPACGTEGTVEQRIASCATSALGGSWSLVTRTAWGSEVWRDNLSQVLWGDLLRIPGGPVYHELGINRAREACEDPDSYADAKGGLSGLSWVLPLRRDFALAEEHSVRQVLPRLTVPQRELLFWTLTIYNAGWEDEQAAVFYGRDGKFGYIPTYFGTVARCVVRPD
jgi:hypothetical protein